MKGRNPHLVSPRWLASKLGGPDIAVVDASWYLPDQNRNAMSEYQAAHIPGATFFDIDAISDKASHLPHMLPSYDQFAEIVGKMGIAATDIIVVYDGLGLFSAARVWWTFRIFGAKKVYILDGGFPAWLAAGFAVSSHVEAPQLKVFLPFFDHTKVRSKSQMLDIVASSSASIVDARPAQRFAGTAPEPRTGLRSGHMPGAQSVPIGLLVENGHLKSRTDLEAVFTAQDVDLTGDVVTTCGSGITAAIITLALDSIGHREHALYDGSWAEWGKDGGTPVVSIGNGSSEHVVSKPRMLCAHITALEMRARPSSREPLPRGLKGSLIKTKFIAPSFYRYLYTEVGKPHHWNLRRNMNDTRLGADISKETCEIWVLSVEGCPAGFFELDFVKMPVQAEIQYFGLLPEYRGRGLARFMLSEAINAAWDKGPSLVAIQTNTLDSPKALALYQKAGFQPVSTHDELIEAWD